jgi:hypothetical protein
LFSSQTGNPTADRILEALRGLSDPNQGLDGTQQRDLFNRHATRAELEAARDLLHELGFVEHLKVETSGRPRIVTFLASDGSDVSDRSRLPNHVQSLRSLRSLREQRSDA